MKPPRGKGLNKITEAKIKAFWMKRGPQKARGPIKSRKQNLKHFGRNEAQKTRCSIKSGSKNQGISEKQSLQEARGSALYKRGKSMHPATLSKQIEKPNALPTTVTMLKRTPKASSLNASICDSQHIEYIPALNLRAGGQSSAQRWRGNHLECSAHIHAGPAQVTM
jgi:hypothetical protein